MRRKPNPGRFRKRNATNLPDLDARSGALRTVRDLVQRGQFASALAQIDQEVGATGDDGFKARLLCFAADALFKQGKFSEAANTFAQVAQLAQAHPSVWLRPALGEIRSLLKDTQVGAALLRAQAAIQAAHVQQTQYQEQLAQVNATLAAGGQAVIPAQPATPAEVAGRLAKHFFSEGEITAAKALFQQSLQLSPGGIPARLGLAEIALREDNGAEAARLAREAITLGNYHSVTLAAWNLLLAAGRKLGTDMLDASLLNGLAQATPKVRSRAVLLIAGGLRSQGDARWQTIASNWLTQSGANHPKFAAELRKLKSAQARRMNALPVDQLQAAQALLQTPNLSPTEWLAATKETVRLQFLLNQAPQLDALITQGATLFGAGRRFAFIHGLALACKQAGRNDFAIQLFQRIVANATGAAQVRAQWALAKMQAAQSDHAGAAQNYWAASQNTAARPRQRIFALMQWTREIAAANQPDLVAQARPQIEAALPQITDYELVLDLSRQILFSSLPRSFSRQVFQRGQELALQAFDAAGHPAAATTILFKFCRRASDFHYNDAIIGTWARLTEARRQWLWSERQDYWYYIELVFRAYRDSNLHAQAEQFITPRLDDPATPAQGCAILGASYAILKRKQGDIQGVFAVYEKMAQVAPTHEWTSPAYYWFALRAWKQGNFAQISTFADKLLQALGADLGLYWKKDYNVAAWLLKAGLQAAQVPPQASLATADLQKQLAVIQDDLALLSA
jgi:hypothetical protein